MPPKPLTAEEIIQRCAHTYSSVRSFTGRSRVSTTIAMRGMPKTTMQAEATIAFVRPGKLRVEGFTLSGIHRTTYLVVSDGKKSWLKTSLRPQVEESTDVSIHIAAVTGIGYGAPTTVPALLMRQAWGYPFVGSARLLGRERMQGVECYKIRIESPVAQITVWIDTGQFLLRRMYQKHDVKALRSMMPEEGNANFDQMESTHDFVEQKVNQTVPETLFRKP